MSAPTRKNYLTSHRATATKTATKAKSDEFELTPELTEMLGKIHPAESFREGVKTIAQYYIYDLWRLKKGKILTESQRAKEIRELRDCAQALSVKLDDAFGGDVGKALLWAMLGDKESVPLRIHEAARRLLNEKDCRPQLEALIYWSDEALKKKPKKTSLRTNNNLVVELADLFEAHDLKVTSFSDGPFCKIIAAILTLHPDESPGEDPQHKAHHLAKRYLNYLKSS